MRRVANPRWLTPVVAAFLVAGCGLTTTKVRTVQPKTLSHAQFVHRANRACARERRATRGLTRPTSLATLVRNLRLGTKAYERTIFDLRRLTPPPSDAASFHELLHALDRSDLTLHQLLYAVEAGRARSAKALARKADAASKRLNSMAARLGLHVCAKP